ncbi:glycoside hydrolase superfamily [Gorgonomyces haynaldii]|nr:glycoside hydrolase superfamily [Gorgonomyces haynaldii]
MSPDLKWGRVALNPGSSHKTSCDGRFVRFLSTDRFSVIMLFGSVLAQAQIKQGPAVGVQLFQWPFRDIAKECVEFLGPNGYSFVQTSPVQAHVADAKDGWTLPWYLIYQPLGYNIGNRLGTEEDFKAMVQTCKNAGVDIVVDVVLNHNAYFGLSGQGGFGSTNPWSSSIKAESFPDPGFTAEHYHDNICNGPIDWNNDFSVWNCQLAKLVDVATEHPYVRSKIVEFLNKLTSYGVVGYRTDIAKCVPLADWLAISSKLTPNYRNLKPFFSQEVGFAFADGTYKNYELNGRVMNFDYGTTVGQAFRNLYGQTTDKLESIIARQLLSDGNSTVFIENHDKERDPQGVDNWATSQISTWFYKQAIAFNILYPYGLPIVHSGYGFQYRGGEPTRELPVSAPYGPDGLILSVPRFANNTCGNGWLCQHRYSDVFPLVRVRNYLADGLGYKPKINTNGPGSNQIWWNVPGKAFVVINSAQGNRGSAEDMIQTLDTGLPAGTYCNMVYGFASGNTCQLWPGVVLGNQETVQYVVNAQGRTTVRIRSGDKSRVVALYTATDGVIQPVVPSTSVVPTTVAPTVTITDIFTTVAPTPTAVPTTVAVSFKVTHDTGVGDAVYVVGSFNNWDTCNAVKCNWSAGNVWQCGPTNLQPGTVYQWKAIQFGTRTGTTCKTPVWQSGNNNQFTASSNFVASTAY